MLPDADLEAAADAASFGAFMNSGQICMSTERIVADRAIAADLGAKLAERAAKLTVGDPREQTTMIGPVVNDAARERILELIEDARAKGAEVLTGGDADGNLITPTVLANVTPEMRIYEEESFGPVVTIVPVSSTEEAIDTANDTEYGLSAAVFSADVDQAMEVARRIESGICHINSSTVHDEPQMPFGGVKASGWGRFGGKAALEEFTELRWMTIQQGRATARSSRVHGYSPVSPGRTKTRPRTKELTWPRRPRQTGRQRPRRARRPASATARAPSPRSAAPRRRLGAEQPRERERRRGQALGDAAVGGLVSAAKSLGGAAVRRGKSVATRSKAASAAGARPPRSSRRP